MVATAAETETPTRWSSLLWQLAPVGVALLAAGTAAIHIRRSFTLPEVEQVLHAQGSWRDLVPIWHPDAGSGVYLALLKGWLHVGSAEWVARLPSLVAVSLAAAAVYGLGARLFERRVGLAAGALFALSSYTTGLGREVGPLALAVLLATLATWLFVIACESSAVFPWAAYACIAAGSVYVHPSCPLILAAHGGALYVNRRWDSKRVAVLAALPALLAAPAVVLVLARHRHLIDPLPQPSLADVARALHDASGRNVALLALAAGGAAALALGRGVRAETWRIVLLAVWATAPLAASLVLSIARPSLDPRYLAVATPALALLAGAGLVALPRRELVAVAVVAVVALGGVRLVQLERSNPENWRAAVSFAVHARGERDRIVVAPPRAISALAFYAGPDVGSVDPGGRVAYVIVRADDRDALALARRAVRVPAYALRDTHSFGDLLQVQIWEQTGLPVP